MTETWSLKKYLQIGLHLKGVSVSLKLVNVKKNNINEKCYQRIIHHEAFSKFLNKNLCITAVQSHGS